MDKTTLNKTARDRARGLSGQIALPTILLGVLVIPAYWSIPYLVVFKDLSLWLAIPLMVLLTYAAYTVLHESVHGLINGSYKNLKWSVPKNKSTKDIHEIGDIIFIKNILSLTTCKE